MRMNLECLVLRWRPGGTQRAAAVRRWSWSRNGSHPGRGGAVVRLVLTVLSHDT